MKLVLIEWVDSHSGRGWKQMEDLKGTAKPLPCKSVGWLFFDGREAKVVVPHVSQDGLQGVGDITIPTCAIKKITVLKEKQ